MAQLGLRDNREFVRTIDHQVKYFHRLANQGARLVSISRPVRRVGGG